eukprot:ctg_254.g109
MGHTHPGHGAAVRGAHPLHQPEKEEHVTLRGVSKAIGSGDGSRAVDSRREFLHRAHGNLEEWPGRRRSSVPGVHAGGVHAALRFSHRPHPLCASLLAPRLPAKITSLDVHRFGRQPLHDATHLTRIGRCALCSRAAAVSIPSARSVLLPGPPHQCATTPDCSAAAALRRSRDAPARSGLCGAARAGQSVWLRRRAEGGAGTGRPAVRCGAQLVSGERLYRRHSGGDDGAGQPGIGVECTPAGATQLSSVGVPWSGANRSVAGVPGARIRCRARSGARRVGFRGGARPGRPCRRRGRAAHLAHLPWHGVRRANRSATVSCAWCSARGRRGARGTPRVAFGAAAQRHPTRCRCGGAIHTQDTDGDDPGVDAACGRGIVHRCRAHRSGAAADGHHVAQCTADGVIGRHGARGTPARASAVVAQRRPDATDAAVATAGGRIPSGRAPHRAARCIHGDAGAATLDVYRHWRQRGRSRGSAGGSVARVAAQRGGARRRRRPRHLVRHLVGGVSRTPQCDDAARGVSGAAPKSAAARRSWRCRCGHRVHVPAGHSVDGARRAHLPRGGGVPATDHRVGRQRHRVGGGQHRGASAVSVKGTRGRQR